MKTTILNLTAAIFVAASLQTHAQGFMYDQQSATNPIVPRGRVGVDGLDIQPDPLTQSFIPTLSAIGFVQLEFQDIMGNGNNGATVYVNLWTGSPNINSATFLGSTTPVYMPDGFGDNGNSAGDTNFYFSSPIALTSGQTYYLQPVVQSGDNPWDIITIGNTYPNGQLFEKGLGFSTDMWFREGIVSAPEPTALALIGLSGLLAYAFKRRSKLFVMLGAGALLFGSVHAQTISLQSTPDTVVQAVADDAGLVPATVLPRTGTFWVMMAGPNGNLTSLPYPSLPPSLSGLPVFSITANAFLVDDTGGQVFSRSTSARMSRAQVASAVQAQADTVAGLIANMQGDGLSPGTNGGAGFYSNSFNYQLPTNGLWLELLTEDQTNLWLRLHGTVESDNYQLLSTTNLSNTNWDLGDIIFWADGDEDDFPSAIPMTNPAAFFLAHHANPVMALWDNTNSIEPSSANNDPGQVGAIGVYDEIEWSPLTNDMPVYYTISGTAQNGIDYSTITGVATIPAGQHWTFVYIQPLDVGLKPDRTIVLTLVQNTNYLIDPPYLSVTNMIFANSALYPVVRGENQYPCPNTPWPIDLASDASDPRNLPLTYSIVTWPTHGTLTGTPPNVTYTATNCYEGLDSFTFTASDGQFTSAPATVNLFISSGVCAFQVSAQTCRGTPVGLWLNGGAYCGETCSYAVVSNPLYGTVTNASGQATDPGYVYTPNDTNFTGTDSFNYRVTDDCGDSATNTVTITVGDAKITPNSQTMMTGTNQPAAITLSASDYDSCNDDPSNYLYTVISGPAHGTLSGTPPNVTYMPNTNYEGVDSFQFKASDGVWTSATSGSVTIYVVAGPILMLDCNPFRTGPAVELDWIPDTAVQQMEQQYSFISHYKIYRASVSGGPYTCIYTAGINQMSYMDTNVVAGQTNYYVVNFESPNSTGSTNYESPLSNEIVVTSRNPNDLIAPDAIWTVWDVTDTNRAPNHLGDLRAPFGMPVNYDTDHPTWPPLVPVNTTNWINWSDCNVWSNQLTLNLTNYTSQQLSNVVYSIAIDNDYQLYVNSQLIDQTNYNHGSGATWAAFKPLNATNNLVAGDNNIAVVIWGDCDSVDYFSMIVTTNTCGQ